MTPRTVAEKASNDGFWRVLKGLEAEQGVLGEQSGIWEP